MNGIIANLESQVKECLEQAGNPSILLGISGGADSVSLARAFESVNADFRCVHCNFRLRGEESERDREFVENLCSKHGWQLDIVTFDVEAYRRKHCVSIEMACRELRYERFFSIIKERGLQRVAVAHNSDDQAETVLLNLFRGAGISGLRGMLPDTGKVIRPLLGVDRKSIEAYLKELNQEYIIDSTNIQSEYKRNFIRNELMPLIETRWPAAKRAINRTSYNIASEEKTLFWLQNNLIRNSEIITYGEIETSPDPMWLIRRFSALHGADSNVSAEIIRTYRSCTARSGKHWNINGGELVFSPVGLEWIAQETEQSFTDSMLQESSSLDFSNQDLKNHFLIRGFDNGPDLLDRIKKERDNSVLWISVNPDDCIFRRRRDGDRMQPLGMKCSRLVSDVVSDARLSAVEKRKLCIVEYAPTGDIIWVEGLKRSGKYLVTKEASKVYCISRRKQI